VVAYKIECLCREPEEVAFEEHWRCLVVCLFACCCEGQCVTEASVSAQNDFAIRICSALETMVVLCCRLRAIISSLRSRGSLLSGLSSVVDRD